MEYLLRIALVVAVALVVVFAGGLCVETACTMCEAAHLPRGDVRDGGRALVKALAAAVGAPAVAAAVLLPRPVESAAQPPVGFAIAPSALRI